MEAVATGGRKPESGWGPALTAAWARPAVWSARDIARLGMLLALATSLHVFEAQLPTLPIPGAKIGLANLVSLFALYAWGFREALLIAVMRQIVGSLVTGTLFAPAFAFGMAGGVLSVIVMAALLRFGTRVLGPVAVSLAGATAHNVGQLLVAWAMLGQPQVFFYLPYLLWFAVPSGALVGVTATKLLPFADLLVPSPGEEVHPGHTPPLASYAESAVAAGRAHSVGARPSTHSTLSARQARTHQRAAWAMGAFLIVAGVVISVALTWQPAAVAHPTAKVTVAGEVQAMLPLDHEGRHELFFGGERMVIEVSHGRVRVVESTCPDQICVGTGWIAHTKEAIACVPAQVLITIIGGEPPELEYDALVY